MPPSGAVPVDALLKLSLDKAGAQGIQDFLDKQEGSFSRIEQYAGKISGHFEGLTRGALGLAGIAGIGAIVSQMLSTTTAGGLVGLSAGQVTGGAGVGVGYGKALLSAQGQTGVAAPDIAQGLIQAVQAVGGTPSPAQAAVLGGLLAGYGQTVGLSPSQVAAVISPILQASHRPLTESGVLGAGAMLSAGLTAFPGSQAAPMLGLASSLATSQAIGLRPGMTPDLHGIVAGMNAMAQIDPIWRNPGLLGSGINSISGGLQNAYGNPAMEAFLQRAGVSYWDQRKGWTPQNAQAVIGEATSLYGTGVTRDLALRSMFGLTGAKLLEETAPGTPGAAILKHDLGMHLHPSQAQLQHQIHNAQLAHTPASDLSKLSADALKWLMNPWHAGAALLGGGALLKLGSKGLNLALKGVGRGGAAAGSAIWNAVRGGSGAAASAEPLWMQIAGEGVDSGGGEAGGSALAKALGAGSKLLGPLAAVGVPLVLADPSNAPGISPQAAEQYAVRHAVQRAAGVFGAGNLRSPAAQEYMRWLLLNTKNRQIYGLGYGSAGDHGGTLSPGAASSGSERLLGQVFSAGKRTASGKDPLDAFTQGASDLEKAAQGLLQWLQSKNGPGFASYNPQSGWLGTPGVQGMGAMAPGVEFAALIGGGSNSASFASFTGGAVGGTGASSGVPVSTGGSSSVGPGGAPITGGQSCTLTWYDPALGGTNSGSGQPDPNSPTYSGVPYSPTAYTCAADLSLYPVGTILEIAYHGKRCQVVVNDKGGAVNGNHFDLSRASATYLGMIQAGVVTATFRVVKRGTGHTTAAAGVPGSGGGRPGQVPAMALAATAGGSGAAGGAGGGGGGGSDVQVAAGGPSGLGGHHHHHHHHHIYVDGKEIRTHRIITGHHRS